MWRITCTGVNSKTNLCLLSKIPSVLTRFPHTRATAAAHPVEFEVSKCRTAQFARSSFCQVKSLPGTSLPGQVCMWNNLHHMFDTWRLDGFNGCSQPLIASLSCVSFQFSVANVIVVLREEFVNNFFFSAWGCAAGFNINNNNNVKEAITPVVTAYVVYMLTIYRVVMQQLRYANALQFHAIVNTAVFILAGTSG